MTEHSLQSKRDTLNSITHNKVDYPGQMGEPPNATVRLSATEYWWMEKELKAAWKHQEAVVMAYLQKLESDEFLKRLVLSKSEHLSGHDAYKPFREALKSKGLKPGKT